MARFLLLAVSLVCLSVYCTNAVNLGSYRAQAVNAFNAKRRAYGLSQVSQSSALNNLAQSWAKTGHNYVKNTFNGGRFVYELTFKQYGSQATSAAKVMNSWLSGSTKKTITKGGYSKMGFGLAYKNGAYSMVGMWQ